MAELTREVGIETGRSIAELGPGTGVVTERIRSLLPEEATFLASRRMSTGSGCLASAIRTWTWSTVTPRSCTATQIKAGLALRCGDRGLPFSIFDEPLQRAILGAIQASIAPGGHFTTFAYLQGLKLPAGRRFRRLLEEHFETVAVSDVVWKNTPPAVVYRARSASASD